MGKHAQQQPHQQQPPQQAKHTHPQLDKQGNVKNPMTRGVAARIQAHEAKANDGKVEKGGWAARAQVRHALLMRGQMGTRADVCRHGLRRRLERPRAPECVDVSLQAAAARNEPQQGGK